MRKTLHSILAGFNIILLFLLLLSYLSVYISPRVGWMFAFLGLVYPLLLILNLLFIFYWLIRKRYRMLIISIIVVGSGWKHLSNMIQIHYEKENRATSDSLFTVLSYNVRLFNLYDWAHNIKTRNDIFEFLNGQQPDIICFQEFYTNESGYFSTLDTLHDFLKAKEYHIRFTEHAVNRQHFGAATFSVFPIIDRKDVPFQDTKNICIYTDIKVGKDTIRVFNCHLESIRFQPEHYKFMDSLNWKLEEKNITGVKNIIRKMKTAYIKRAAQAEIIARHIENSPYPVIVCGDFNDTPVSYTYRKIRNKLNDSFVVSGNGIGNTYVGVFPSFRIDYILHSDSLFSFHYRSPQVRYSDHFPILSDFKIP